MVRRGLFYLLLIGVVVLAACTTATNNQPQRQTQEVESNFNELSQKQAAGQAQGQQEQVQMGEESINALSGYRPYNKEEFEAALASDKVVFLEFHAVWCPICNTLEPKIYAAFEELPADKVVGFKADFDTQTELKKKYNVISQHTHIIIKNKEVKLKSLETWEKEDVKNAILGVLNG